MTTKHEAQSETQSSLYLFFTYHAYPIWFMYSLSVVFYLVISYQVYIFLLTPGLLLNLSPFYLETDDTLSFLRQV